MEMNDKPSKFITADDKTLDEVDCLWAIVDKGLSYPGMIAQSGVVGLDGEATFVFDSFLHGRLTETVPIVECYSTKELVIQHLPQNKGHTPKE